MNGHGPLAAFDSGALSLRGVCAARRLRDRKSTRLNSSHGYISYAVFCLKKKKSPNHNPAEQIGVSVRHIACDFLGIRRNNESANRDRPASATMRVSERATRTCHLSVRDP